MYRDIMVDLETMGCREDAVILQIGACYFDRYTGDIDRTFTVNIDMQDSVDHDRTIDTNTIKFWLDQKVTWLAAPLPFREALLLFSDFAREGRYAWAHATFDFPILISAYRDLELKLPFHYRAMRDLRTLVDLAGVDYMEVKRQERSDEHHALADCVFQVQYAAECFRKLSEGKIY